MRWSELPVLKLQLPVKGDLEPGGKRRQPAWPPHPRASVIPFPLSRELPLAPRASLDDAPVALDDSRGGASGLRTSPTCEARAKGHVAASVCEQLHWAASR